MNLSKRVGDVAIWSLFVWSVLCTATAWYFFDGVEQQAASFGAIAVSLVAGRMLTGREPVRTWLRTPAVLVGLVLVNVVAAVVVLLIAPGVAGVVAGICLGVVALGAAVGLVQMRRDRRAVADVGVLAR